MTSDHIKEDQLKLGILGAANIAKKNCAAIKNLNSVVIVAVGSRDVAKAQAFIDEWDLSSTAQAYSSYEAVLDDPNVEAVYIPLPTTLHVEWVRKAAAKGKHILLEKPIAVTASDTDALVAACAAHNVQLMDGTMWMHHPRALKMQKVLDSGRLGEIKEVIGTFTFYAPPEFQARDIRFKKAGDPLGCLGDVGWYCIRGILWAFNYEAPLLVQAGPGVIFNGEGVPISLTGTLIFSGGRRGVFTCSFDRATTQRLEIGGTAGSMTINDFVIPFDPAKAEIVVTRDHCWGPNERWDATQKDVLIVHHTTPQEGLMWDKFAECVANAKAGKGVDRHWIDISVLTQKVVCAMMESAVAGGVEIAFSQSSKI